MSGAKAGQHPTHHPNHQSHPHKTTRQQGLQDGWSGCGSRLAAFSPPALPSDARRLPGAQAVVLASDPVLAEEVTLRTQVAESRAAAVLELAAAERCDTVAAADRLARIRQQGRMGARGAGGRRSSVAPNHCGRVLLWVGSGVAQGGGARGEG